MNILVVLWLVLVLSTSQAITRTYKVKENAGRAYLNLRIMTFNIWNSGANVEDGIYKIAKHIRIVDADIIAIQEVEPDCLDKILQNLGGSYVGVAGRLHYPNVGIITKHQIISGSYENTDDNTAVGVQIKLYTQQIINFWCLHLDYLSYGPYAANNKMVTNISQIMAGENAPSGRVSNIVGLLANKRFQQVVKDDTVPLIACGDFNVPSHLDWVESTKHLHGDWVVPWPATQLLQAGSGLIDTFREMHPDPLRTPGITWSPVQVASGSEWQYSIPEPQDRLDFIMRKGNMLKTIDSFTYAGTEKLVPEPNHSQNDWPSDHYSVITDFALSQTK